jgi:hypothetical protein
VTHEYPPNRAFDSVSISRVSALREYGLTLRQREFLVPVMVQKVVGDKATALKEHARRA